MGSGANGGPDYSGLALQIANTFGNQAVSKELASAMKELFGEATFIRLVCFLGQVTRGA